MSRARRSTDTPSSALRAHGVCLFGPRVRFPDDATNRSYVTVLTMTIRRMYILAALTRRQLDAFGDATGAAFAWTRTTVVVLAAPASPDRVRSVTHQPHVPRAGGGVSDLPFVRPSDHGITRSTLGGARDESQTRPPVVLDRRRHAHPDPRPCNRREVEELSLVMQCAGARAATRLGCDRDFGWRSGQPQRCRSLPRLHHRGPEHRTWPHARRCGYRGVSELVTPVFAHNRIVRDQRWRRHRHRRARVEHALARLKDWRVLRDHRRRGHALEDTMKAVATLHNLRIELRDNS